MKNTFAIDTTRASRDGHEFHEAWVARVALQLLLPSNKLAGIAVEGLQPVDQRTARSETVEIADVVLYFGKEPTFDGADHLKIIQCKYSISSADKEYRASDAQKTISKFALAYLDHKRRYGAKKTDEKLQFELVTNRPVSPALERAIVSIVNSEPLHGQIKKQAQQFSAASGLSGEELTEFARKVQITGQAGSLSENKKGLSRTIVDWSAADDAIARARLGQMRQMVRDKAGHAGTHKNVIVLVDVLAALELADIDDLLPCPASLPEVGRVVPREQLAEAVALVGTLDKPLLIHAAGGVGKTVFLEGLAELLSTRNEVLLFDCFGGGRYRSPEDSRHLPKRGLVHIVNTLAGHGLCDPLLPGNESVQSLMSAFRRRLEQCIKTLSLLSPGSRLVLMIDAIDNAAEHAKDRNEVSFPTLLLQSFQHGGSIPGVDLIVSCRSHRIEISTKGVPYHDFQLHPFSLSETETYLRDRLPKVTPTEIQVAQSRSGGNPRILEHLVTSDRGLLDPSEIEKKIELDDLLNRRIERALADAVQRGYEEKDIHAFLAGLSVLPPPVPLDEYAGAHNMAVSAIESFAADLAPLLERTKYGLMFRDEPTETLIRESFGSDKNALQRVARNLMDRQDTSVYAARALPGLLQKLDNRKRLFELAFDTRFPQSITSLVGQRKIQYARLKSATLQAANHNDYDRLVHLLVALSTIAAVDQKGAEYILEYPDLVIAAQDVDATRRLFETRTPWPGTRHARLSIANALSGDFNDAFRHSASAYEWLIHFYQQDHTRHVDQSRPERLDVAAIPFCLILQNRAKDANAFIQGWKQWYSFEIAEHLFGLLEQAESATSGSIWSINGFLNDAVDGIGLIVAALSFLELTDAQKIPLIGKLSKVMRREKQLEVNDGFRREGNYLLQEGLLKASVIGMSLGMTEAAVRILKHIPNERPGIWSFQDRFSLDRRSFHFLARAALQSVITGKELRELDILPEELYGVSTSMRRTTPLAKLTKALKKRLEQMAQTKSESAKEDQKPISSELKHEAENFLDSRLEPLLMLTKAFATVLKALPGPADTAFTALLDSWEKARQKQDRYSSQEFSLFFDLLGLQFAEFALWVCPDLKPAAVQKFLELLHKRKTLSAITLINTVAILAKRKHLLEIAGQESVKANSLIQEEYEVATRASLYAQLARAILPASREEAAAYFRVGLEQMDAIGSGDYRFTNELLRFASTVKGAELEDKDVHTLTNICELNMPDEEEKFPWFDFAKGLARISGSKTLAKLARWDDRAKVSLDYTLLPYLTALVTEGKLTPEDAIALNRLANPVELYACDTGMFAKAIDGKNAPNNQLLISELIEQFEVNNPSIPLSSTVGTLASIAQKSLGKNSATAAYLSSAQKLYSARRDELNENMNYHGQPGPQLLKRAVNEDGSKQVSLKALVAQTDPNDPASTQYAVDKLNEMDRAYDLRKEFFQLLRSKVAFPDRPQYVKTISRLENLNIYTKLEELKTCKTEWNSSSAALSPTYRDLATPILELHAENFISYDQLSDDRLKEVSDLSGISTSTLALELIKVLASSDPLSPASAWLGLASVICDRAAASEGRLALMRLLNSDAAKLASSVADGEWKPGSYPSNEVREIASGLVWRMLGSPRAADRWRAAHSLRSFAKFGRWEVIDAIVAKFPMEDAYPFQAPELQFYFMHARLWLLIALARIALDAPHGIARHHKALLKIALDSNSDHVLMRHFASQAIMTCVNSKVLALSPKVLKQIQSVNVSPLPRLNDKLRGSRFSNMYIDRPDNAPEPKARFHLDYDFEKSYVEQLSRVFGKPKWQVADMISDVVRRFDSEVPNMYEAGGRRGDRSTTYGMTSKYHTYGQQLGWHALFMVAGKLLSQFPVTEDSYDDEPWKEFLRRWVITRKDGLWLSDGRTRTPLEVKVNLLEKADKGLKITGDKSKIEGLVGIRPKGRTKSIAVQGDWRSPDDIEVYIRSVLVKPSKARASARRLIREEPMSVWLPVYDQYEEHETLHRNYPDDYTPWIVHPSVDPMLDEDDPLGTVDTTRRARFSDKVIDKLSLKSNDAFKQVWRSASGKTAGLSEAWGYHNRYSDEPDQSGTRLLCSSELLKQVLTAFGSDLLILVTLRRYEKGIGMSESKFSHTVAVLRISKTLDMKYHAGAINQYTRSRFDK